MCREYLCKHDEWLHLREVFVPPSDFMELLVHLLHRLYNLLGR